MVESGNFILIIGLSSVDKTSIRDRLMHDRSNSQFQFRVIDFERHFGEVDLVDWEYQKGDFELNKRSARTLIRLLAGVKAIIYVIDPILTQTQTSEHAFFWFKHTIGFLASCKVPLLRRFQILPRSYKFQEHPFHHYLRLPCGIFFHKFDQIPVNQRIGKIAELKQLYLVKQTHNNISYEILLRDGIVAQFLSKIQVQSSPSQAERNRLITQASLTIHDDNPKQFEKNKVQIRSPQQHCELCGRSKEELEELNRIKPSNLSRQIKQIPIIDLKRLMAVCTECFQESD